MLLVWLWVLAMPTAAQAAATDGMGCPQGYVAFDAQRGEGGPPSYRPGGTVTASGFLTEAKAKGAPSVTLRWGAPSGAALGQAAIDSEGSWKGLSFVVPETMAHGAYTLYLEARDASGNMLPGLPIPAQLRVGLPPVVDPAAAPRARERAAKPKLTTQRPAERARPGRTAARSPAPPPSPALEEAAPTTRIGAGRARRRPVRSIINRRAERHSIAGGGLRAARAAKRVGETQPLALEAIFSTLLAAGVLLGWRRRRRVGMSGSGRAPVEPAGPRVCEIEVELQEMICEVRATELPGQPAAEPPPVPDETLTGTR